MIHHNLLIIGSRGECYENSFPKYKEGDRFWITSTFQIPVGFNIKINVQT